MHFFWLVRLLSDVFCWMLRLSSDVFLSGGEMLS